jgi:hypothetical protein
VLFNLIKRTTKCQKDPKRESESDLINSLPFAMDEPNATRSIMVQTRKDVAEHANNTNLFQKIN